LLTPPPVFAFLDPDPSREDDFSRAISASFLLTMIVYLMAKSVQQLDGAMVWVANS
jgi:hypothetical protein